MIKASMIGNLFNDVKAVPTSGGSTLYAFSLAVKGRNKEDKPTAVDCTFFVQEGKKPPFVIEDLKKGNQVAVLDGELHTEAGKDGRTYLKCRVANAYSGIMVRGKRDQVQATEQVQDDPNDTPF